MDLNVCVLDSILLQVHAALLAVQLVKLVSGC